MQKKVNLTAFVFLIGKRIKQKGKKITTSDNGKKITKPF